MPNARSHVGLNHEPNDTIINMARKYTIHTIHEQQFQLKYL